MLLDAQHNNIMLFVCVSFEPCNQLLLRLFTQRSPFLRAVLCFFRPNNIEGKIQRNQTKNKKSFQIYVLFAAGTLKFAQLLFSISIVKPGTRGDWNWELLKLFFFFAKIVKL